MTGDRDTHIRGQSPILTVQGCQGESTYLPGIRGNLIQFVFKQYGGYSFILVLHIGTVNTH